MTPARRDGLSSTLARWYVRAKVQGFFRGVWARGEAPSGESSVLVYANHAGFWDGFVLHELAVAWGREPFCLVEEHNLERFPFLARLGAFSIRPGDAGSTLESFRYVRGLLARPRAAVFVFPQGRLEPSGVRPPRLERGFEVLARRCGARCVPLALKYAFFESERPDALVAVGAAHTPAGTAELSTRLAELMDGLEQSRSPDAYRRVVRGSEGVATRWERFKHHFGRRPRSSGC